MTQVGLCVLCPLDVTSRLLVSIISVYADDMVLLVPSPGALQDSIDTAAKYFADNGLMVNRKKNRCMVIILLCNKDIHIQSFYVRGTKISRVQHKNYLGYYFR